MEIKIWMRHLQMVNIVGTPIIYSGASPATLRAIAGTVPQTEWKDFSADIIDIDKISLEWSEDIDASGNSTGGSDGNQIKRTASGSIGIESDAYMFIKAWCIDHVAAPLNAIDVRIETDCGNFEGYKITAQQLTRCEGEFICQFDLTLKQQDEALECLQKTIISDNEYGWFQTVPAAGKKHPRFSYCNEIRPNGIMIFQWMLAGILSAVVFLLIPIIFIIDVIIAIINTIIFILRTIVAFLVTAISFGGIDVPFPDWSDWEVIRLIPLNIFQEVLLVFFVESAGCGREHPAPLIRDYIQNVCDKCGITVDPVTAPFFFADRWNVDLIDSEGNNLRGQVNEYYNACYLNAPWKRGIRRFNGLKIFGGTSKNTTDFFIEGNAPQLALNDFLDQIKGVFNAEWRLKGNKLYFWRKDWFRDGSLLYDFSINGADRYKILEGICFEWNEVKYPASCRGLYGQDAVDTCANEALAQMNGFILTFGKTENNPNFDGVLDKTTQIGGTKFRLDGASTDYIYDAMQTVCNLQIIAPWIVITMRDVDSFMAEYANYALLMRDETCALPKILIWDGENYMNAKCVREVVPVNNRLVPTSRTPPVNVKYNLEATNKTIIEAWNVRHPCENFVIGSAISGGGSSDGIYEALDYFGALVANNAARLVNYPMYYEPGYKGTLWDRFHYIDDPRINPSMHQTWEVYIDACCEDIERLQLLGDGSGVKLGELVKLEGPFYNVGKITDIKLNFNSEEEIGKSIKLKGNL